MNKQKGPIYLTERWVKQEEIKETLKVPKKKKTHLEVSEKIVKNIQWLLEWKTNNSQWENINFVNLLCDSFWFNFDIHTQIETKWIDKNDITYTYSLNQEWEKIILQLLHYIEVKKCLENELISNISFSRLNNKIEHYNSNYKSNIIVKSDYTIEELDELLKQVDNDSDIKIEVDKLKNRFNKSIKYKKNITRILQEFNVQSFVNLSGNHINNNPELLVIYNKIISESIESVKNQYIPVSYSYSEENTVYIKQKLQEKENKSKQEQEGKDWILSQKLKIESDKNRKEFIKKAMQIWFIVSLASWLIILNKNTPETETINHEQISSKNVEDYANNLYDKLILKEYISDEELFNKFNNLIESFMLTVWSIEWDINKLKWLLVQNIQLTGHSDQLRWRDITMNVSNNWNDTLVINIKIGNHVIMNNRKYSRNPLPKVNSKNKINENNLKKLAQDGIKDYMKQSKNRDELRKNISNNFWYIIRKIFKDYTQYFNVNIQYFWNKIYIKSINNFNWHEYNLYFELDKHLQE